jgi:hypothetical protein
MNEYLKKNFGYEITGDLEALREAKASLEVTKAELKDEYMSAKYVENMLMIETITSLLKAHGSTKSESVNEDLDNSDKTIPKDIVISGESVEDRIQDCLNGACWWPARTNDEDDSHFYEHGLAEKIAKMMCDVFGVDHISKLPHSIETPLEDAVYMETTADQGARSDKPLSHGNESKIIEAIYQTKKEFYKILYVDKSKEASVSGEERRRLSKEKRENPDMNEEEVSVDNEGNIAGYLDYIDECIDQINHDNLSEMAYRIQNAVDDIRTRELDLKASLVRDKFNENDDDEELINKVAMWIYHESDSPISEIEHLLKKSGAVGDYMDAVSESKEKVTEDDEEEKGPEHYRWKNDSQLSQAERLLAVCIEKLDDAITYRAENSHLFFNNGDKAGTGDLYGMKDKLEKLLDNWDEHTEYYGM